MEHTYLKDKPNQLIIIGGGTSIREGIEKGLWDILPGKFVIGTNYSFNYHTATIQCYLDNKFFQEEKEKLKTLPLIVTKTHQKNQLNNQITLKLNSKGTRDLKNGVYKGSLTGIFALSLSIYLLDVGEIFLLGYDFGAQGKGDKGRQLTHFYQGKLNHRGVGKVNYYHTSGRAERDFLPFTKEKKIKIYNVSMNSKINTFKKISYDEFFKKLDNKKYCQSHLRAFTKVQLSKVVQ